MHEEILMKILQRCFFDYIDFCILRYNWTFISSEPTRKGAPQSRGGGYGGGHGGGHGGGGRNHNASRGKVKTQPLSFTLLLKIFQKNLSNHHFIASELHFISYEIKLLTAKLKSEGCLNCFNLTFPLGPSCLLSAPEWCSPVFQTPSKSTIRNDILHPKQTGSATQCSPA